MARRTKPIDYTDEGKPVFAAPRAYSRPELPGYDYSQEVWAPCILKPGWQVSDLGRIRSPISTWHTGKAWMRAGGVPYHGLINTGSHGYSIAPGGTLVHRMVAHAFLGPQPDWAQVVMHIDEDKYNNRLDNLKYGTQQENLNGEIARARISRGVRLARERQRCVLQASSS